MMNFKSFQQINQNVKKAYEDMNDNWKLNYHFEPPFGLINDPNGLSYYNGEYHIFFQWNPHSCEHKYKHWGLVKTKDFVDYSVPRLVLEPVESFDKNGCYSGSGFEYNGNLELLYTGNVKDEEGNRESYQVRAVCDKEGNVNKIEPVVSEIPEGYTAHFRDPKIFERNGKYYFVIGAQTSDLKGRVLLYSSDDFSTWKFEGEIKTNYEDFGFMWECPGLLNIDGKDILIFSPQGLEKEEFKNQNIYQSGYIVGNLDFETLEFKHGEFRELDMGFDFYAPQCFKDNKNRDIMIGWMGMPEEEEGHPTSKYNRMHCLTMAREISLKDGVLYQKPLEEYKALREELLVDISNAKGSQYASHNIENNSYELDLDFDKHEAESLELRFAVSHDEYTSLNIDFLNNVVSLSRENMTEGYKGIRKLKTNLGDNVKLHVFMDNSAIEIYLNDGAEVLSARLYPEEGSRGFNFLSKNGNININKMKVWSLKGVSYNE